ncbi:MAG: sulfotransferase [Gammaproteobacteria bacterium]|nr:sulfotransferase [Gammaproteobacteria bacterium]MDA7995950.1 sulfotransferase [Gammaproteobacteria bacterium]
MNKLPPEKIFARSVEKLRGGDAAAAARGFEKVAKAVPDSARVWYNLGLSRQYLRLHAKAADAYARALRIDPKNADAHVNLGLSQKELMRLDAAQASADAALAVAPGHPRALNLAGTLLAERNEHDAAQDAFARALRAEPENMDARHNLANLILQRGDGDAALELAQPLFARARPEKRHRILHGQILLKLKKFGEAQKITRELLKEFGEDAETLLLEMSLCELIKDHFGVVDAARKALAHAPDNAGAWNALGSAYFQLDGVEKAAESYEKAIQLAPDVAEYRNNRGLAHASKGEKAEAEAHYRRALELAPDYAETYRNLVAMKKYKDAGDEDVRAMERMWSGEARAEDDFTRTKLAFALGKVYDDLGEYARAFDCYAEGNRMKFAESGLDFDKYFAHIDGVPEVFTEPPREQSGVSASPAPIFIVGMPRSGTTLVEQILSRHPNVTGCGELPCIEKAIARMEKRAEPMRVYPRDFPGIGAGTLAEETRHYLSWVARLHDMRTGFFTDKMPFNFVHVWLIKALFPAAAIVHCHRHPLDVILSNYFQLYASDISFVYDLQVLARYYVRYYRLMRHWRKVFGGEIHKVQYETLVGDKEEETRRLIAAAKLPWDDACLDMKKSDAAVRTASIWQVRRGIYTTSRERWRNYEAQLAPAIAVLREEGVLDENLGETA